MRTRIASSWGYAWTVPYCRCFVGPVGVCSILSVHTHGSCGSQNESTRGGAACCYVWILMSDLHSYTWLLWEKLDFCLLLMDICVGSTVTLWCNGILPTSVKSSTSLLLQTVTFAKHAPQRRSCLLLCVNFTVWWFSHVHNITVQTGFLLCADGQHCTLDCYITL